MVSMCKDSSVLVCSQILSPLLSPTFIFAFTYSKGSDWLSVTLVIAVKVWSCHSEGSERYLIRLGFQFHSICLRECGITCPCIV